MTTTTVLMASEPTSTAKPSPLMTPELFKYEEPLYTEIRIPLPPVPKQYKKGYMDPTKPRSRAHTLSSFLPFQHHHRTSSSSSTKSDPETSKEGSVVGSLKNSVVKGRKRGQTLEALAVAPAMLMLKTELFTPAEKRDMELEEGMQSGGEGVK
ncbi:hypothetical protein CC78DRAFT_547828 [Lojkania enalia]|uniref:Uncharacterized protein n=1 Tax=Lojkania enalia TaxID=147567 RepID=A0A9P4K242_9PLEO|nr:hypothetical protein CC78DRAFT_547828 [Didymosphaeria enalia]